jgi:hypothetical protein
MADTAEVKAAMRTIILGLGLAAGVSAPADAQGSCAAAPPVAVEFAPYLADSTVLFRGQFSPDGKAFYYFKKVTPEQEDYRIFVSRLEGNMWSRPERILIGGEVSELYPAVTPDGERLVYSSYSPVQGDTSSHPNAHLYVAQRRGDGWGTPTLQRLASRIGWYHSGPIVGPDSALYFGITSPDWRTAITMRSQWNGREYGVPAPYSEAERFRSWRRDQYMVWGAQPANSDSVMLVFVSARKAGGGTHPADIFASLRRNGQWTDPAPLGAGVNTPESVENFAAITPDGCELVFTRGFSRFYRVSLAEAIAQAQRP